LLRRHDALPALHPARAILRARVIEENLPMARRLARRYVGRGEPLDDLAQVAAMALAKAVDGYDSSREIPFISYAIPSIVGALKRHFRDATRGMRVPRAMQELVLVVRTASGELARRLGRPATPTEVAEHLNVALEHLLAAQAAALAYRPISLDASLVTADDRSMGAAMRVADRQRPDVP
jgi:RNA polymerase sigma-B factor